MAERATAVQLSKEPTTFKALPLENLFDRADAIFDAISRRAYEIYDSNGHSMGHDLDHWFQAERELLHPVHLEVTESSDLLDVKAEVPGFCEKELEIKVEPRRLVISGKREAKNVEKKGKTVYSETCSDQIMRVINLPADVETDRFATTLKNGVLDINLRKAVKTGSAQVEAKAAA